MGYIGRHLGVDLATYLGTNFASNAFTTEWTVAGDAAARTITLPLVSGYNYNCVVDWGDNTTPSLVTSYNDANRIHTYVSDGTYDVKIYGVCQGWAFNNGGDKLKITDIINWGSKPTFGGFAYLGGGFYGCSNLASLGPINSQIPDDGLLNASNCFINSGVSSTIPTNLLKQLTSVTDLNNFMRDCSGLTGSIPADLLRYNTLVTNLSVFMYGCSGLTGSIPTDLLRYNTLVTNLSYFMYSCSGLTGSIPTDLLRYNTLVTNLGVFMGNCPGLTGSIPADLLRYNTLVTDLNSFMYNCSGLTDYGADLLRYNTSCVNFSSFMHSCINMQQRSDTFYRPGEETTRFLNQSPNFTSCFERNSFTGTQGTAPDLWNCSFGTGTPITTNCWAGAGNSAASLTNYASIPGGWI